ncbi:UNVERIFIED_CONTAM: hypothetical protein PYX00_003707 [Menopon gallinae]
MADADTMGNIKNEPRSIKLPDSVEMFGNLKNAKRFAIDIGGSLTKIAYYSTVSHRRALYNCEKPDNCDNSNKLNGNNCENDENLLTVNNESSDQFNGNKLSLYCNSNETELPPVKKLALEDVDVNNGESQEFDSRGESSSQSYDGLETSRLHFIKFETKYIESCLDFIKSHLIESNMRGKSIKATGGGAFKYANLIHEKLGLSVDKEDEICCLIKGTNFLLKNISDEAFIFERHGNPEYVFQNADPNIFPYLLVNIGSGVSVLKVVDDGSYERIGGTATGGGTFWGLGSLLTSAKTFDELLELAEGGDHRKVDMLVSDIYGGDYTSLGLSADIIASSFGKVMSFKNGKIKGHSENKFSESDLARSLLFTISNDIGQIACLYAMMHNLKKVYFGGYFLRNHPLSMHTISFSIRYWSQGEVQALFLRHEGYLGAIGAFLKGAEEYDTQKYSWLENYAGSSGLVSSISAKLSSRNEHGEISEPVTMEIGQLEMDRWNSRVCFCPLLSNPKAYCPDTVDLTTDNEAREYWLECFKGSSQKFRTRAEESQPDSPSSKHRAEKFQQKFLVRLQYLKKKPFAYGHLTVRSLLDTIEHFLKEFDFPDPYWKQKQMENEYAISLFSDHVRSLDQLPWDVRQEKLIVYLLAGNMFDWGAKEVAALLENKNNNFGFEQALEKIPRRPWLIDNLDKWIERLKRPPHKCAAIFVDNSGLDVVLGVLPFARELVKRGTEVILCSNSAPALNDVTHTEMLGILKQISRICPVIREAQEKGTLIAMETGQTGPCLDLSRVSEALCEEMVKRSVDLIVIEGMGRSVHTNLNAVFTCESLKVAVIKNRWLAQRLGGEMFSVICRYQGLQSYL